MPNDDTDRPAITSAQRIAVFSLLAANVSTGERRLFAVVDAAACVIDHGNNTGTARLLFEVVAPELAGRAVRLLTGQPR